MGRQPCCDSTVVKRGAWTAEEDKKLTCFILGNGGRCSWPAMPKLAGLLRCGKSCRLRWTNYLRPGLKRGLLTGDEERLLVNLHAKLGNRWSKIAAKFPGRTDNDIKNHWNTHIKKKLIKMGIDPATHGPLKSQKQSQEESPATASEHSSTIMVDSRSMDGAQEDKHINTNKNVTFDSGESSLLESSRISTNDTTGGNIENHDLLVKWLLEEDEDLPTDVVDESWLDFTTIDNANELKNITATTQWDIAGVTDWLLDYKDFVVADSSLLVGISMVDSSSG